MEDLLKYFLLLFLSYSGLIVGLIISYFVKEEVSQGKKYFPVLKTFIFSLIFYLFLMNLNLPYYLSFPLIIIVSILSFLWEKKIKHINTEVFFYSFFAIIFYEMKYNPLITLLIFIYGIASASVNAEHMKDIKLPGQLFVLLSNNLIYIIMGTLLKLLFRI